MATVITALILLGFIALAVGIVMFVHKRDQKREALRLRSGQAEKINTL